MSCVKGAVEEIFFVRWVVPEIDDARAIVDDVRCLREQVGRPVRYVAIIGPDVDPPNEDVRSSMRQNIDDLLRHCSSVHIVIEAKDVRRAMARNIGSSIFLPTKDRGRTYAHDNVQQALERIGMIGPEAEEVLERARARNLLSSPAA